MAESIQERVNGDLPDEQAEPLKILTIQDILAADDLPTKTIHLPEWGGAVVLRALTRAEIKRAYKMGTDKRTNEVDPDLVEKYLVCWASQNPKITPPVFDQLANKNAGPIVKIIDAVLGLSGVDKAALDRARESFRD